MNKTATKIRFATNWRAIKHALELDAALLKSPALRECVEYVIREAEVNTLDTMPEYPRMVADGTHVDEVVAAKYCFIGSAGALACSVDYAIRERVCRWFRIRGIEG